MSERIEQIKAHIKYAEATKNHQCCSVDELTYLLAEVEYLTRELGGANTIIRALAHREGGSLTVTHRDLLTAPMPWTMARTDDLDGNMTITVTQP